MDHGHYYESYYGPPGSQHAQDALPKRETEMNILLEPEKHDPTTAQRTPEDLRREVQLLEKKKTQLFAQIRHATAELAVLNSLGDQLRSMLQEKPLQQLLGNLSTDTEHYEAELWRSLLNKGLAALHGTGSQSAAIAQVRDHARAENGYLETYLRELERQDASPEVRASVRNQIAKLESVVPVVISHLMQ
jgi:hypothetical protein